MQLLIILILADIPGFSIVQTFRYLGLRAELVMVGFTVMPTGKRILVHV
jgi:hypothetical protein